jgi:hypothetical protein
MSSALPVLARMQLAANLAKHGFDLSYMLCAQSTAAVLQSPAAAAAAAAESMHGHSLAVGTCAVAGRARSLLSIFSNVALNSSRVRPSAGTCSSHVCAAGQQPFSWQGSLPLAVAALHTALPTLHE